MDPIYSKVMFGVGLAMAVGAVVAIFISSPSEEQNNQGTEGQTQDITQTRQGSPNNNNMTS